MRTILVNLVSRQVMQNIIPAFYLKPDKVILVTTAEELKTAENIVNVLNRNKISSEIFNDKIDAYNVDTSICASKKIIDLFKGNEIILNFTGGTKLMSIPAYEEFRKNNCKLIYCDSEHQRILWFGNHILEDKYNVTISIKDYLNAHGYKPNKEKNKRFRVDNNLMKFIEDNFEDFLEFTLFFKNIITELKKSGEYAFGRFNVSLSNSNLTLDFDNKEIFKTESKNTNYLIGNWLEDYVYYKIKQNNPDEIYKNYFILSSAASENEIDVIFTKNGNLTLISCKNIKNMDKKDLFEHEGLRNLTGGTFSRGFVVVNDKSEVNIKRASDLRLHLLTASDIKEGKFII